MKKISLRCSECESTKVVLYKVQFEDGSWHVRGVCCCGRARGLPKRFFFRADLPELKTEIAQKKAQVEWSF